MTMFIKFEKKNSITRTFNIIKYIIKKLHYIIIVL